MPIRVANNLNMGGLVPDHVTERAVEAAAKHVLEIAVGKAPLLTGEALKKANDQRRADPGALRRSGYVRVLDPVTAEVGFSEFYAGWQHERLDYEHVDGQAKFLEEPLATELQPVLQIIADDIRESMTT